MLDAHKGYLAQIVSAEKESESEIEQGRLRIMALQEKGKDNQFKNSLDKLAYDPQKQVSALESHAQTLIREAERVMAEGAKLGDKAEIQRGRQIFQEAEAANKQAEAIASSEVEKGMQGKSPEDIKYAESFDPRVTSAQGYTQSTIDAQIRAEERINALERQRIRNLGDERDYQSAQTSEIEKQVAIAVKNSAVLDKQGNPLPKAELARMQGIRDAA